MTLTPLLNTQITDMDEARMTFAHELNHHITKLREELRINELLLQAVLRSISAQTESMAQLDAQLDADRTNSAHHRPMLSNEGAEELLAKLEDTLSNKPTN